MGGDGNDREAGSAAGTAPPPRAGADPVAGAIDELRAALEENAKEEQALSGGLERAQRVRQRGRSWGEIFGSQRAGGPLVLLASISRRLVESGGAFRRALATALVGEGAGLSDVAKVFGVSRQRIFSLLRRPPREASPPSG